MYVKNPASSSKESQDDVYSRQYRQYCPRRHGKMAHQVCITFLKSASGVFLKHLIFKTFCSTFYREAVENMVHYNAQLLKDRKSRLPYVDAQTGIAQSNSHLLRSRLERRRGVLPGQIYSYPPYRWRQESKPAVLTKKGKIIQILK